MIDFHSTFSSQASFICKSLPWTQYTLAAGIDVGKGINVGPGKFGKRNKRRAFYVVSNHLNDLYVLIRPYGLEKIQIDKRRAYVYSGG